MEKFNFKKKFGQNFITDKNLISKIVDSADIDKESLVIEIGPGMGAMTTMILDKCKNGIIYEIDKELEPILNEKLASYDNYELIFEDFLVSNVKEKLLNYKYNKLLIVANLPYYITTPIIKKIIEDNILADKIVIMIQEEVADRFSATVGTKEYGSITVFLNYFYNVKKLFNVNRKLFVPQPNVDSAVISLDLKKDNLNLCDNIKFSQLVRDSFQYKRKNLRNNLKKYDLDKIEGILKKYNLSLNDRAEVVPLEAFIEIGKII